MKPRIVYHKKDEIIHPVRRASGDCICDICGVTYYRHTHHVYSDLPNARDEYGPDNMALHLIETCRGELFKL